jgi:CCR4-NOT transcription complex subunit 1
MRRFFDVMWFILTVSLNDEEIVTGFVLLLHELRPLIVPMFGFIWVELVTNRRFLHQLILYVCDGSDFLTTLICDFEAAVVVAQDSKNGEVFKKLYHGLLRFILILVHDFPAFVFQVASEIVLFLPPGFLQLRNIILAAASVPVPLPSNEARRHLLQVPGIEEFTEIPQPFRPLVERLGFAEAIKNMSVFSELTNQFISQKSGSTIGAFVIFLGNMIGKALPIPQIVESIQTTHIYFLLSTLIEKFEYDSNLILLNALLDQLRQPSKNTLIFLKVLLALFRSVVRSGQVTIPINISEILLRVILERTSIPPPHPWGLRLLVCELLENRTHGLWEMPCVARSKDVDGFLRSAAQVLGAVLA